MAEILPPELPLGGNAPDGSLVIPICREMAEVDYSRSAMFERVMRAASNPSNVTRIGGKQIRFFNSHYDTKSRCGVCVGVFA